jgi:Ca2+-binding EF-hand superfamily protein
MKLSSLFLALVFTCSLATVEAKAAKAPKKLSPEETFKKKDTNNDGKLTHSEFMVGEKDFAKAKAQFAAKDKNGDGTLSFSEFVGAKTEAPKKKKK